MADKDKLVTLEDLKVAYDDTEGKVSDLKSAIGDITGNPIIPVTSKKHAVDLSGDTVEMSDGYPVMATSSSYDVSIVECSEGDVFTINGTGGSVARLYGFIDDAGNILQRTNAGAMETDKVIETPEDSAFLIVHTSDGRSSYYGEVIKSRTDNLESDMQKVGDGHFASNLSSNPTIPYVISTSKTCVRHSSDYSSYQIRRQNCVRTLSVTANNARSTFVSFAKKELLSNASSGASVADKLCDGEPGRYEVQSSKTERLDIPDDCKYIIIAKKINTENAEPIAVEFFTGAGDDITELINDVGELETAVSMSAYKTAKLPDGYDPKNYILSDGQTMIDTGVNWSVHPTIEMDVQTTGGKLFGNYHTGSRRLYGSIGASWYYGELVVEGSSTTDYTGKRCTIQFSDTQLIIDGTVIQTFDATGVTGSGNTLRLFGMKYTGTGSETDDYADAGTRIYRAKLYKNGTLVFDGVPCVQHSTGYVGFYDLVDNVFHGVETGSPTAVDFKDIGEIADELDALEARIDGGNVKLEDIEKFGTNGVYTSSFSITIPFSGSYKNKIFACTAKYVQGSGVTSVPTIIFKTGTGSNATCYYTIGENGRPKTREWRVVRYPGDKTNLVVSVTIPTGVTLYITEFYSRESDYISRVMTGLRFNGHRRMPMTPRDTLPGIEQAARAGYTAFIEIPKRLSDGKWIFYHDDSIIYNDSGCYIRTSTGELLPSTYNGTSWSTVSYATAMSWDWGIATGSRFAGVKPMTMEEFFSTCAKTGVAPMLSIHPFPSTEQLPEIRAIAEKYGVLKKLGLKLPVSINSANRPKALFAVFGNDIESYTANVVFDSSHPENDQSAVQTVINVMLNIANDSGTECTVRRVVEIGTAKAIFAYSSENPDAYDVFEMIREAGLESSIALGANYSVYNDVEWWAENHGVREFTDEYNWSTGLNW